MSKKKGQSLVEVVVALGILTIVLTSVLTLIISVVNMTLASRSRTEAIALAQKGIAEGSTHLFNGCNFTDVYDTIFDSLNTQLDTSTKDITLTLLETTDPTLPSTLSTDFSNDNFAVLKAVVTWTDKGLPGIQKYELREVIQKN